MRILSPTSFSFFLILSLSFFKTALAELPPEPIIVAVIDSGIDINHPDLRDHIWVNSQEIPNNGIDDDYNNFTDDIVGWNFIGARNGNAEISVEGSAATISHQRLDLQIKADSSALVREFNYLFGLNNRSNEQNERLVYLQNKILTKLRRAHNFIDEYNRDKTAFEFAADIFNLSPAEINDINSLKDFTIETRQQELAFKFLRDSLSMGLNYEFILEELDTFQTQIDFHYNINLNQRETLVADNPKELIEQGYGNNDITGPNDSHGSLVSYFLLQAAGDIPIKIMPIRAIPDGLERDKDIINAIYYAVNNGAQIINMSFGKYFSEHSKEVWEAMQFAESEGVLIVLAAGNEKLDLTQVSSYPNPVFEGLKLDNIITVGACDDVGNLTVFTNYGNLDVCAPGLNLSAPPLTDSDVSGTSFAAPQISAFSAKLVLDGYNIYEIVSILKNHHFISLKN